MSQEKTTEMSQWKNKPSCQ